MKQNPIRQRKPNPEKIKDMVESILPAKVRGRKVAYYYKRLERRRVRHVVKYNLSHCDHEGYTDKDLFLKPFQSVNISMRRDSDKVNPFLRWAKRKTNGMSETQALFCIKGLLPRGVIGEHAYSHWETVRRTRRYH